MTFLSRESVIGAGVALVRREGLDALSMRSVAAELGATPMALYRYVTDGVELQSAVVASILELLPPVPAFGSWKERYRSWAVDTRTALGGFPGVAQYLLTGWFAIPAVLITVEQLLGVARHHGKSGFGAVAETNAVFMYVLMRLIAEQSVRDAKVVRRELAIVGRAGFPLLRANLPHYQTARMDEHFLFGLEALLAGFPTTRRSPAKDRT